MDIIVHKHFTIKPPADVHHQYSTPVWEVEIRSPLLDAPEFEAELYDNNNFVVSKGHRNNLRSIYTANGVVSEFLSGSQQELLLNLVSQSPSFQSRYYKPLDEYQSRTSWFATVLRDQAGFAMTPHLDNNHIMVQMIANLLQDNTTSTEFYQFNKTEPCYRAPLKKNHGVVFLNTPGSVHGIANVTKTRWILYGGLLI